MCIVADGWSGVHLNIVGMKKCMDDVLRNVLQPLAMYVYRRRPPSLIVFL